ncbi:uncharacterized protein (TIGR00369 family) [Dysgonomonadaceae bacterium PH5-43]|nr:uncharacterized protein (TIGR00369 family) [Dysgonomonadaceae bacterium PH5-43]
MTEEVREKLIDRVTRNPYVNHLQIQFTKVEDGVVEAVMPLFEHQRQYSGVIHGGILAAVGDTVAGFAAYTLTPPDKDVLSAEINVSFLRATWGDKLIAKAKIIKPGRNIHFGECEIFCNDKMVCKVTGTFCVVVKQV